MSTQTTLNYRTNRDLFSNYHLDEHLPETEAWDQVDDDELQAAYDEIKQLWEREKSTAPQRNESQLEEKFIRPMFRKLGIPFEVEESTEGTQRRPDYGFFETEEDGVDAFQRREEDGDFYKNAIAVADAKRWGRKLDTRGEKKRDYENPSHQIDQYLRFTSTTWGVLTNGQKWRLYYKPTSHRLDSYYEIDLPTVLEQGDLDDFKYFYLFFRHEAFVPDSSGDAFLDDVYEESNVFAQELGEDLQDNIYEAIKLLAEGYLQYPENDLDEENLELIHDSSLIYLYRIIFVLYAEAEGRDLLNTNNEIYESQYSLNQLKQEVADELESGDPKYRDWQSNLQSRLDELFMLIDQGSKSRGIPEEDLYIPAYNGGLFRTNPDESGSKEARFLADNTVGDEHLARVIELLTRSQGSNGSGKIFVDYSSLDVRHLGSVYEGLLEYQLNVANEPLALDDGEYVAANESSEIVVERGDVYLTTGSGERKATGSYYTPEYVVEYIVEETLRGPVDNIRKEVVMDERFQDGGYAEEFAERVFDLNILDPAMGSGHFLTSVVDYLARAIITEQNREAEDKDGDVIDDEHDINWARRKVAQRCIYGVDINPLATELAKVSLWLRTLAAEQPLAFLDHHLKTGNSLVGSDIEDVISDSEDNDTEDGQLTLQQSFDHTRQRAMEHVTDRFQDLLNIDNETLEDAKEMEAVYDDVRDDLLYKKLLAMANVHTADAFGLGIPSDADERMANALHSDAWEKIEQQDWFKSAQAMAEDERFFHWELEFPMAFYDQDGERKSDAGFDAVIGNPPYIRIQELRGLDTGQADYLISEYKSATKSFDIYVNFTEKGYELLKDGRLLSYIEPHKFFNADFGEGLRNYLSQRQALREVLSFGQHQVFPGASVYTCILTLEKGGRDEFRYTSKEPEAVIQSDDLDFHVSRAEYTSEPWIFQSPETQGVLDSIEAAGPELGKITSKIYQGVVTSADDIFLVEVKEMQEDIATVENGNGECFKIESELLHPFLKGQDVKRYSPLEPPQAIVLPYRTDSESTPKFIEEDVLENEYGYAHKYFLSHESELRGRDGGSMDSPRWYDLTRNQNMDEFSKSKIVTPEISYGGNFAYDSGGLFHKSKVYGIIFDEEWIEFEKEILAILNSKLLWFYLQNTGYVLRGGYFTFKTDYLSPFSIPNKDTFRQKNGESSIRDSLVSKVSKAIDCREERQSINLNLLDYFGNYEHGPNLPDIGIFQPTSSNILDATTEDYRKLQIERARTQRSGSTITIEATARYKPEDEEEFETDSYGYTETDFFEAFTLTNLSNKEAILVETFVPVAVNKAGGFANFRDNATKTNSLIDRLKAMTLPEIDDVDDDLERYISVKERADELDEKIEKTEQLIDEIVYDLYNLTDEEIEVVESVIAND